MSSPLRTSSLANVTSTIAVAFVLGAGAVLAGCGGGDSDGGSSSSASATSTGVGAPQPKESIDEQVATFNRAVSSRAFSGQSCVDALEVIHPERLPDPDGGASAENCAAVRFFLDQVRGFKATASMELGTGAVVDGQVNGEQRSLIWAIDSTGSFKWTGAFLPRHEVDTEPAAGVEFAAPAGAFVDAVRNRDCAGAFAQLLGESRLAGKDQKSFCSSFATIFTSRPESLGSRLQADHAAAPVALGTTRDLGFFALATSPSGYRTIVVNMPAVPPARVFDVVPGPGT